MRENHSSSCGGKLQEEQCYIRHSLHVWGPWGRARPGWGLSVAGTGKSQNEDVLVCLISRNHEMGVGVGACVAS